MIESKNKDVISLQLKIDNLEDTVSHNKIERKKLIDEKKELETEKIKLKEQLSGAQKLEKKVTTSTQDKATITNLVTFFSRDSQTIENMNLIPTTKQSTSNTSSQVSTSSNLLSANTSSSASPSYLLYQHQPSLE